MTLTYEHLAQIKRVEVLLLKQDNHAQLCRSPSMYKLYSVKRGGLNNALVKSAIHISLAVSAD